MLSKLQKLCIGGSCIVSIILLFLVLYFMKKPQQKESFSSDIILPKIPYLGDPKKILNMAKDLKLSHKARKTLEKNSPL